MSAILTQQKTGSLSQQPAGGRRLRVAMVIERYLPHVAGAELQLQALIGPLARRGVEVVILTRHQPGLRRRELVDGVRVVRLPNAVGRLSGSLLFTLAGLLFLARHRRRLDLVHAHDPFSPTTMALLGRLLLGLPVVTELLRGGRLGDLAVLRGVRSGPIREQLLVGLVDRFIAVSEEIAAELRTAGVPNQRIAGLPNGVDTARFRPVDPDRRATLRRALGLPGGPLALYLGRLEPEKRVDCLLAAWPAVLRERPDALLLVVGDGWQRATLEARAGVGVRFVGLVRDPLPYLQSADAFVLPSDTEGLPNALLEAMAVGLPCVATSIGGTTDALRDGREGWLVPPLAVEPLAEALIAALTGPDRWRRGQAARARVSERYGLELTADRLSALYRELLAGPARRLAPRRLSQ